MGARNRRKGLSKQSKARKKLGVGSQKFGDSNEEKWVDALFRNEVKAGKQIGPAVTAWSKIEAQVDANRPDVGDDGRPCRAVLMPDGWSDGIVMLRLEAWQQVVLPALNSFYGPQTGEG